MSNLLNTAEGRNVVVQAQRYLLRRRLSRFFKRDLVVDYENWSHGVAEFDLGTLTELLNEDNDDELLDLYRLLGTVGGLDESIADTTYTVDPTNGSDTTGTGSATRPYASLWFIPWLPRRINHLYRILIPNDIDLGGVLQIDSAFGPDGCLSFIGVGAAVEVLGGTAGALTGAVTFQTCQRELTLNTAPSADAINAFVQMTAGLQNLHAAPVTAVDIANQQIYCRERALPGGVATDTYIYVEPAVSFTCRGIDQVAGGSEHEGWTATAQRTRVNFVNLKVIIDEQSLTVRDVINIDSKVGTGFWFCQIRTEADSPSNPVINFRSDVNASSPVDPDLTTLSASGVVNTCPQTPGFAVNSAGLQVIKKTGTWDKQQTVIGVSKRCEIVSVDCMATWQMERALSRLYACSVAYLRTFYSTCDCENVFFDSEVGQTLGAWDIYDSIATALQVLIGRADYAVNMLNSRLRWESGGGDAAATITVISLASFHLNGLSLVYLDNPWTGTASLGTDLLFNDTAAPTPLPFPGANSTQTDALGSRCTRGA